MKEGREATDIIPVFLIDAMRRATEANTKRKADEILLTAIVQATAHALAK